MLPVRRLLCLVLFLGLSTKPLLSQEAESPAELSFTAASQVQKLVEQTRDSIVVITTNGRDGTQRGIGTGFVVGADGLIATNLHVIGEGRPITVQMHNGRRHEVVSIEAYSRPQDLALIRIDARDLKPLALGDSDKLAQGVPVVALGNPLGFRYSVVAGLVSAVRKIDNQDMIQVAMPIEPGNSGGPLLDMQGQVQGILSMKSLVQANLGFAITINQLKPLLEKPHPVLISRWLTIGTLNPRDWQAHMGARWRQRAGRIQVDGLGDGFGGRSLCLWQQEVPSVPYELEVTLRLADESGAAGLVFAANGKDESYGFYPSGGKLRFTRFNGPDISTWAIQHDAPTTAYRPGDWNTLRVRREADVTRCFVNDELVYESHDQSLAGALVGLTQFRRTEAEFKSFRIATELPKSTPSTPDVETLVEHFLSGDSLNASDSLAPLLATADLNVQALRNRARQLDRQAEQLRTWATQVHHQAVLRELAELLDKPDADIDLFHAALLVARLDNEEVDVAAYRHELDGMADELIRSNMGETDSAARLARLNKYLFEDQGFHGSRSDYYHRANSYVNEVLDDREGLPITLSIIYLELGRRLGLDLVGIGIPGHFCVGHRAGAGELQLIDVFEQGAAVSREEAERRIQANIDRPPSDDDFAPVSKRTIVLRMFRNLLGSARAEQDIRQMLHYLDAILALDSESASDHWTRAMVRFQTGDRSGARDDADWLIQHPAEGIDLDQVRQLRALADQQ
jgi:S1-C subfamily serine protease/regulator of sirC expression with transglutaminase-like and TPR domain